MWGALSVLIQRKQRGVWADHNGGRMASTWALLGEFGVKMTYFCICQKVLFGCSKILPTENIQFISENNFSCTSIWQSSCKKNQLHCCHSLGWIELGQKNKRWQKVGAQAWKLGGQTWNWPHHPTAHSHPQGSKVLTVRESPRAATTWMSAGLRVCTERQADMLESGKRAEGIVYPFASCQYQKQDCMCV